MCISSNGIIKLIWNREYKLRKKKQILTEIKEFSQIGSYCVGGKNWKMFSGFSNQVTSWMGAVKGEPHDEEVPTPTLQQGVEPPPAQIEPQTSSQALEDVPITNEGEEGVNVQRFVY